MITDRCTIGCSTCGRNEGIIGDADEDVLGRLCEEISRHSVWRVSLTGGEPLEHANIAQIIHKLKKAPVNVSVNTNGVFVQRDIDLLAHVDSVCISLDGTEATHEGLRGNGTYEAVCRGLEGLRKKRVAKKLVCTIGRSTTKSDVDNVIRIARMYDAPVTFQPGRVKILGSHRPNPEAPEQGEFTRMTRHIMQLKGEYPRFITNSRKGLAYLMRWPDPTPIQCSAGRFFCRIDPAGDIYPCSNIIEGVRPIGNIVRDGIALPFRGRTMEHCTECWCGLRVEANLMLALGMEPLFNYARLALRK